MKRRLFLWGAIGTVSTILAPVLFVATRGSAAADVQGLADIQKQWHALLSESMDITLSVEPISKAEAEWRTQLDPKAYKVLFQEGTERPFSSPLNDEKRPGIYACAACSLPLFTSDMKYDSGTGWPSFFTHIPNHVDTKLDFKLVWPRTEYHCIKCSGHQGHVFEDGPQPTGQRWCNNGIALRFLPA